MSKSTIMMYIFLFMLLVSSCFSSEWFNQGLSSWIRVKSPIFSSYMGPNTFNKTAYLTKPINDICKKPKSKIQYLNKIAWTFDGSLNQKGCSWENIVRNVQYGGAVGMIYVPRFAASYGEQGEHIPEVSLGEYSLDTSAKDDITIPYVQIKPYEMKGILTRMKDGNEDILFHLFPDNNPYKTPFNIFLFLRIFAWSFFLPWNLLNLYYSIITFYSYYKRDKYLSFTSLPQLTLSIEILSGILRTVFLSMGAFMSHHLLSYSAFHILLSITWPLGVCSSLLIAFFWKAHVDQIIVFKPGGLRPNRVIVILIAFCDILISLAVSIMRAGYYPVNQWVPISAFFEIIVNGSIGYYFITTGRQLIQSLEKLSIDSPTSSDDTNLYYISMKKISRWIMFSGIFTLIFLSSLFVYGTPYCFTPIGWIIASISCFIGLLGTSSTQILAFRTQVKNLNIEEYAMKSVSSTNSPKINPLKKTSLIKHVRIAHPEMKNNIPIIQE